MNPHSVIAGSDGSVVVVHETKANQGAGSPCEDVSVFESSPAQNTTHRDRADHSDKWLTTERHGSDPIQGRTLTLDEIIKRTLVRVLRETRGNRRRTAILLGISRSTLYRMLERYDIGRIGREASSRKIRVDLAARTVPPDPTA
jgi:DNA-binding protein Fis